MMARIKILAMVALAVQGGAPVLAATTVAVVNVPQASDRYHKRSDLEAQFESVRENLNQKRTALQEKIDRTKRSLQEELKPGSDAYRTRSLELAQLEAEMQWFMETEANRVEQQLASSLKSIYKDIQAAVAEIAKEKGIDIVLAADELPATPAENTRQARQEIMLQKVVYWQPKVDITDDVVERLNSKYATERSQTP